MSGRESLSSCDARVKFPMGPGLIDYCHLPKGHDGMHELEDGFRWLDLPAPSSGVDQGSNDR